MKSLFAPKKVDEEIKEDVDQDKSKESKRKTVNFVAEDVDQNEPLLDDKERNISLEDKWKSSV